MFAFIIINQIPIITGVRDYDSWVDLPLISKIWLFARSGISKISIFKKHIFGKIKAHKIQTMEIHCCIVKSTNLSTIFAVLYKKIEIKIFRMLSWQHFDVQWEPAFSVGQLPILHVKSMFGKYR